MTELVKHSVKYDVKINKIDAPIVLEEDLGKLLFMVLQSKDCPSFIPIKGTLYNRFEILSVTPNGGLTEKQRAMREAEEKYYQEALKMREAKIEKIQSLNH